MVKIWKVSPKLGEMIKKDKENICKVVLLFARRVTLTGFSPSFAVKCCLSEEITISLIIIIYSYTWCLQWMRA